MSTIHFLRVSFLYYRGKEQDAVSWRWVYAPAPSSWTHPCWTWRGCLRVFAAGGRWASEPEPAGGSLGRSPATRERTKTFIYTAESILNPESIIHHFSPGESLWFCRQPALPLYYSLPLYPPWRPSLAHIKARVWSVLRTREGERRGGCQTPSCGRDINLHVLETLRHE